MKGGIVLDECGFPELLAQLDRASFKVIKLKEGSLYYGQVEEVDLAQENGREAMTESRLQMTKKVRHGFGVQFFYKADGSLIARYEGFWSRGRKSGEGYVIYSDKAFYKGSFKNNVREGQGLYVWPSGHSYQGGWKDDKMDGTGVFRQPNVGQSDQDELLSGQFKCNSFISQKGVLLNPFASPKDMSEFTERRELILQKLAKAATPSEKGLVFEVTESQARLLEVCRFCKEKGRVPVFLSSKG